jgi:hypothetical protein
MSSNFSPCRRVTQSNFLRPTKTPVERNLGNLVVPDGAIRNTRKVDIQLRAEERRNRFRQSSGGKTFFFETFSLGSEVHFLKTQQMEQALERDHESCASRQISGCRISRIADRGLPENGHGGPNSNGKGGSKTNKSNQAKPL